MVRYPTEVKKSFRKGVNAEPVTKGWVKKRKADNSRKPPPHTRKRKRHARPRARKNPEVTTQRLKENKDKWESSLKPNDKLATTAVFCAQQKLALGTLRPPGYRMLMSALPKSWKIKPTKRGDRCIAVPHGTGGMNILAAWLPCFFVNEYFPNKATYSFFVMRRTQYALMADKRLSVFFVVLSTDCFIVPKKFSEEFMAHYELNTGVYVLKSDKDDVYVGWSKDITKRLAFHNKGMGATFTIGSRWWRIAPLRPSDAPPLIRYTPESEEMLLQQDRAKKTGGGRVRGGAFTATRRKK